MLKNKGKSEEDEDESEEEEDEDEESENIKNKSKGGESDDDKGDEDEDDEESDEDDEDDKSDKKDDKSKKDDEDEDDKDEDDDEDETPVTITKGQLKKLQQTKIKDRIKNKDKKEKPPTQSEEVTIARLEARGVLHPEDQKKVMKMAKLLEITALEALQDDDVKAALEKQQKARTVRKAIPSASKKGSTVTTQTIDWFINRGEMPDHKKQPKLYEKVQNEMARRSKIGA